MVAQLFGSDVARARAFLEAQELAYEPEVDDLVGVHEAGQLVAVGARQRDVLKMIAVAPSEQGGPLLGAIVTELAARAAAAGYAELFVFTRPSNVASFEALNFQLLAACGRVALLESGGGFRRWLESHRAAVRGARNGAAVMNCNPFTRGHRHLVEQAARRVEQLLVFVVREDRSEIPFDVRLRLVQEGTADLANVEVLDTARYAVSALTFPSYFLKRTDDAALLQMELDATLFGQRIAPSFRVRTRFVGSEPLCVATRGYNQVLHRVLPGLGVEMVEIPRATAEGQPISASMVRARLREGRLDDLGALVPPTTASFLASEEGRRIQERIRSSERGSA